MITIQTNKINMDMGTMADSGYSFEEIAIAVMTGDCFADSDYVTYTVFNGYGHEFSVASDEEISINEYGKIRVIHNILTSDGKGGLIYEYAFVTPALIIRSTRDVVLAELESLSKRDFTRRKAQFGRDWVRIPDGDIIFDSKVGGRKISTPK